ncbi:MAG: phycobilisome rod-core linker polypeptide [Gloeomargaritaceae cyanobacterium C42_A2020_066]|nr:phycobilisome rod-core linker polypeptide [Gloeomargaritaceae cyanobacterium C42_A2020_066]
MTLPLLDFAPTATNPRVFGFEVAGDESPRRFTALGQSSAADMDALIAAAYRQVFTEHQMLRANRQTVLESQLRYGQITVRDFIRGLATSETFRRYNYDFNDNYRFVSLLVQRLLGRDVYARREQIAWSIVLGTQGLRGLVDALLDSEEYLASFGEDMVPYQRRRVLPHQVIGETRFSLKTPRYGAYYRQKLGFSQTEDGYRWAWQRPPYPAWARGVGAAIAWGGAIFTAGLVGATFLSFFGIIRL